MAVMGKWLLLGSLIYSETALLEIEIVAVVR